MTTVSIKQNAWGNWYGYIGRKKVIAFNDLPFGSQEDFAKDWLKTKLDELGQTEGTESKQKGTKMSKDKTINKKWFGLRGWNKLDDAAKLAKCADVIKAHKLTQTPDDLLVWCNDNIKAGGAKGKRKAKNKKAVADVATFDPLKKTSYNKLSFDDLQKVASIVAEKIEALKADEIAKKEKEISALQDQLKTLKAK